LHANSGQAEVNATVFREDRNSRKSNSIHALAAKALIRDHSQGIYHISDPVLHQYQVENLRETIIELSKRYSVSSEFTSFLAIKSDEDSTPGNQPTCEELLRTWIVDSLPYMEFGSQQASSEEQRALFDIPSLILEPFDAEEEYQILADENKSSPEKLKSVIKLFVHSETPYYMIGEIQNRIEEQLQLCPQTQIQSLSEELTNFVSTYITPDRGSEHMLIGMNIKARCKYYEIIKSTGAPSKQATAAADKQYSELLNFLRTEISPTHPLALKMQLQYSEFLYQVCNDPDRACRVAKDAFDSGIAELDTLSEDSYKDSTIYMQLLRDNLVLWTSDMANEDEDEDDNAEIKSCEPEEPESEFELVPTKIFVEFQTFVPFWIHAPLDWPVKSVESAEESLKDLLALLRKALPNTAAKIIAELNSGILSTFGFSQLLLLTGHSSIQLVSIVLWIVAILALSGKFVFLEFSFCKVFIVSYQSKQPSRNH
jgi:hypothetical protein